MNIMRFKILVLSFLFWTPQAFCKKVELPFYMPGNATNTMSRFFFNILKDFKLENPNIRVKFHSVDNWNDVLTEVIGVTNLKKSAGVIVAELAELYTLKNANAIISLEEIIKNKDLFFMNFNQNFIKNITDEYGNLYAIPFIRSTAIAYYNMDVMSKANISKHELPKNWNEFELMLEKVKKVTGKPVFGFAPVWYDWLFEAFVRQNNGVLIDMKNKKVLLDSPEVIESLEFLSRLKRKKLLFRPWGNWKTAIHKFSHGEIPVLYYSSGGLQTVFNKAKFKWATSILPKNKVNGSVYGAGNIYLSRYMSKGEIEAAMKLVQFLLRPKIQALITLNSGFFPVIKSALDEPALRSLSQKEQFINAKKQMNYAGSRNVVPNNIQIRKIIKNAIDRTLDDGQSAKESLQQAQKEALQYIK